jgi:hypothetical protein
VTLKTMTRIIGVQPWSEQSWTNVVIPGNRSKVRR